MDTIKQWIDTMNAFLSDNRVYAGYTLYGLLFLASAFFVWQVMKYFRKNQIFKLLWMKFIGNIESSDEIRKKNINQAIKAKKKEIYEKKSDDTSFKGTLNKNVNDIKSKINSLIFYAGLMNIPGFSATTMFILLGIITVAITGIFWLLRGPFLGIAFGLAVQVFFWYGLDCIKYSRRDKLEGQLLQFINDVSAASLQYASIIDIFGVIYPNFTEPLSSALQYCWVEAKRTKEQKKALEHLKEKFDSVEFNFIIDNFILCSEHTGNYTDVANNLTSTIEIYNASYEKKKQMIQGAKLELAAIFGLSIVLLMVSGSILTNMSDTLFHTQVGNVILLAMGGVLFYGLNIRGKRT